MNIHAIRIMGPGCTAVALLLSAGACAHRPPNELTMAREAYQRASTGQAAQLNPSELHKASTALQEAEASFADEHDTQRTRDLAYVADRKAQLAEALAAGQAAEAQQDKAKRAFDQKQSTLVKQTQEQLGETKDQLAQAQQASQVGAQQLAAEQQARAAAELQSKQASDALTALAAKEEARGTVITLSGSVIFRSNESTLLPDAQTRLNQVAEALLQTKERELVIEGHSDSRGSSLLNQSLSQRRAEVVREYLISRGYPAARIAAHGIGAERPIGDNKTSEGRANNRRVEIIRPPRNV